MFLFPIPYFFYKIDVTIDRLAQATCYMYLREPRQYLIVKLTGQNFRSHGSWLSQKSLSYFHTINVIPNVSIPYLMRIKNKIYNSISNLYSLFLV